MALLEAVDNTAGGERFEIADLLGQVGGTGDQMEVILQDDIAVERDSLLCLKKSPGIEQDVHRFSSSEHGKPRHHCAC